MFCYPSIVATMTNPSVAESKRRAELARFLRLCREAARPELIGSSGGGRRRTPGLRREEVASLALVSTTWYTWLEQGRDIRVSKDALERIANALRLSPADAGYLLSLGGYEQSVAHQITSPVEAELQQLLDGFTAGPAFILNAPFDCVAFNRLADFMYNMDGDKGPFARNFVWRLFMDPSRKRLYSHWESAKSQIVGLFRARYANHIGDPEFEELIRTLLDSSTGFARAWNELHKVSLGSVMAVFNIPSIGLIKVHSARLLYPSLPEHILIFLLPADAKTAKLFARLSKQRKSASPDALA